MGNTLAAGRRALALVETISRNQREISFSELADSMKLSAASLTRLLKILLEEDWIRQQLPSGRYTVGYRTLRLAHTLRGFGLHSPLIQGAVTSLAHATGHSACIASFQGDVFVLPVKSEIRNSYHFIDVFAPNTDWIGNGMGQVLLAFQPRDVVMRIYMRNFGIGVPEEDWRRFETIRREKVFIRSEGVVTRVVAAIEDRGSAAVNNVMAIAALNAEAVDTDEILIQVRHAASEASRCLAELHDQPGEALPG